MQNQSDQLAIILNKHISQANGKDEEDIQFDIEEDLQFPSALGYSSIHNIPNKQQNIRELANMIYSKRSSMEIISFALSISAMQQQQAQLPKIGQNPILYHIAGQQEQQPIEEEVSSFQIFADDEEMKQPIDRREERKDSAINIKVLVTDRQLLNFLENAEIKPHLKQIFENALYHFYVKKNQENTCKSYYQVESDFRTISLFRVIEGVQQFSGSGNNGAQVPLLPNEFIYKLLPNTIKIQVSVLEQTLKNEYLDVAVEVQWTQGPLFQVHQQQLQQTKYQREQHFLKQRFIRFMKYFKEMKVCYPRMESADLDYAKNVINQKFIGIEEFVDKFSFKLDIYTTEYFTPPKGILLFGPPGTGKSAISKAFCDESGFVFASNPMAAGDLKKGIVGDSQRTINELSQRAHIVPWDLVFVLIDEIDSLVPDRTQGKNSSGSDDDLISVILSTMDGSKETPNLKIIATTNLLGKMDAAFLRRMEIQLFLGNPSRKSRELWIQRKLQECISKMNGNGKEYFKSMLESVVLNPQIKQSIISSTVNFSADSYRKLLDNFFHQILKNSQQQYEDPMNILRKILIDLSQEVKNYLGSQTIIDIINNKEIYERYLNPRNFDIFKQQANLRTGNLPSKRILFYLNFQRENYQESIQVETIQNIKLGPEQQQIFEILNQWCQANQQPRMLRHSVQGHFEYKHLITAMAIFEGVQIQNDIETKDLYTIIQANQDARKTREMFSQDSHSFADFLTNTRSILNEIQLENGQNIFHTIEDRKQLEIEILLSQIYSSDHQLIESKNHQRILQEFLLAISNQLRQQRLMLSCGSIEDVDIAKRAWLWQLIEFSYEYDADIVKLIDSSYLLQNNAFDDNQAMALINSLVEEIKRYNRAVVIFNLDEIANIKKDYSGIKEAPSHPSAFALYGGNNQATFTYTTQRPQSLQLVFNLFKTVSNQSNVWFVAVAEDQKIAIDFMEATNWKRPRSVFEYEQREKQLDEQFLCTRCGEWYTERENEKEFKCKRHEHEQIVIYERENAQKQIIKQEISMEEALAIINKGQAYKSNFKYTCCGQMLSSRGGEIKTKHTTDPKPHLEHLIRPNY